MFIKWRCTCIPLSFTCNSYGNACIVIFYLIALSTATEKKPHFYPILKIEKNKSTLKLKAKI